MVKEREREEAEKEPSLSVSYYGGVSNTLRGAIALL